MGGYPGAVRLCIQLPTELVQMLPFVMVIVVLVLFARRSYLPAALGRPYVRGER